MNNKQMEILAREHDMSGIDAEFAEELVQTATEGAVNGYQKIENAVVGGYKKIEKGVVDGYKKIEQGVVSGYTKIEDKFVDAYLTKDGETVEEAKARLKRESK